LVGLGISPTRTARTVTATMTLFVYLYFQAFLGAWGIACSLAGFINLVFPFGKTFLVYPVDIGGPCRSKITLTVSLQNQISMSM